MRLAAPFFFAPRAPIAASLFTALKAAFGKPAPRLAPTAPARPVNYCLPQRVRVALQAAARARR